MSVSTITGTARSDKINGTNISETINGAGGSDFINAGGGDDTIIYDGSDKRISGDAGNDTLLLNDTAQQLNLNNQSIQGIESLQLEGSGRHAITLRASDIVRVSDTDILRIKGTAGGLLNSTLNIGTGWTFVSTDGQTQTLRNGQATLIVDLPLVISGVSNNATINTAAGADTSVTEDEGSGLAARPLQATGKLLVDDTNAGQGVLLGAPVAVGTPLGTLTLTLVTADSATAAGVYDYIYSVGNDKLQSLRQGTSVVDSFVVRTVDGTTRTLNFTINGANDAAVIGTPATNTVTEDQDVNSASRLTASGDLGISDPDTGDTPSFVALNQVAATSGAKLGTLTLGTSGAYTYSVSNAAVQSLGSGKTATDTFTVTAADGTTKDISFTINGANDAAVIGDPTVSSVTEDQTANGDHLLKAEGSISVSDADSGQEWFQTSVVSVAGNLGSLALQADGNYVYSVSNALVQSLAGGPPKVDTFTVESLDGTTKTISFAINGVDDPAVIGNPSNFGGTHDPEKPADYILSTTGKFNIIDPDSPGLSFVEQSFYFENYGNLSVGTDGAYYYETYNFVLKTLGGPSMPSVADEFTLTLSDGSKHKVYFNLFGVNDAAVIGDPSVSSVTEDMNVDEANQLTATGTLGIYDPDTGDVPAFLELNQAAATGGAKYGTLTLAADGTYTYSVSNDAVQSLGSGKTATDTFTVTAADGTTKDISFTISGADDAAVVTATNSIVTEDTNVAMNNVIYTQGTFIVSDVDIGDPLPIIKGFPYFNDNTYGLLSYSSREGIYDYQVTNSKLQFLSAGETVTDTFTVTSLDGTFATVVRITLVGLNDAASIGDPTDNTVTEDLDEQNGFLRAVGNISIGDADSGQSLFNTVVSGRPDNLGTLVLQENGSYTYEVSNDSVQFLGAGKTAIDSFTIQAVDGTQKEISFIVNGVNDSAVIGDPSNNSVTEDINVQNGFLRATGFISITDPDSTDTNGFNIVGDAPTFYGGTLTLNSNNSYVYEISNDKWQHLGANESRTDYVQVTSSDGTSKWIGFNIFGANDAPTVVASTSNSFTASVAEKQIYESGSNSTSPQSVSGSFIVFDADQLPSLTSATGSNSFAGQYGTLSFTTGNSDFFTGLRTLNWKYTYSDAALNGLNKNEAVTDIIQLKLTDGFDTLTQNITINLTGAADPPPVFMEVVESGAGYIAHGDTSVASSTGFFSVGPNATNVKVNAFASNTPYLGDLTAQVNNGVLEYEFKVRERYIDYLGSDDMLTQKYAVSWQDQFGETQITQVDVNIAGTDDPGREASILGDAFVTLSAGTIYEILPYWRTSKVKFNGSVDAQIYGSNSSEDMTFGYFDGRPTPSFNNVLVRGGDGLDTFSFETGMSATSEIYGDRGNDRFFIFNQYDNRARLWGGPGSDDYITFAESGGATKIGVPIIEDFDVAAPASGGDTITVGYGSAYGPFPLPPVLSLVNNGAVSEGSTKNLYTLFASGNGMTTALLNLVGTNLTMNDLSDNFIFD